MDRQKVQNIIQNQRNFFAEGKTLDIDYRICALEGLRISIKKHEEEIYEALKKDLGKSNFETYMCEIGMVLEEISYMIKHIRRFAKDKKAKTPLAQYAARSFVKSSPYGTVLIMSPWNYPFMLTFGPLVDAVAAGNTAVLKPSAYSPATSELICKIVKTCFQPAYVAVVTGGREENNYLLEEKFDYIFFTGSQAVGSKIMRHASENLTPVTLELGGKSPSIVDKTAKIDIAARRIVFGKFLNCGQTCVAPDFILCQKKIKDELIYQIQKQIKIQYGERPLENKNYGKIINKHHFDRICGLIDEQKVVYGGGINSDELRIEPTVMSGVEWTDAVMREEIFGPVLPVLTYESIEEVSEKLSGLPKPLALYLFSEDKGTVDFVTERCLFGGGCINDTIIHLANCELGFGGVGASGMGAYHGKVGFDTFSHQKGIVDKKTWIDLPMRYQPYTKMKKSIVKMFLK